jgi:hypothetical protein
MEISMQIGPKEEEKYEALTNVVIHLQIMTAGTKNHADRQSAGYVDALVAVLLRVWIQISWEAELSIQQGPVGEAFGALAIDLESQ